MPKHERQHNQNCVERLSAVFFKVDNERIEKPTVPWRKTARGREKNFMPVRHMPTLSPLAHHHIITAQREMDGLVMCVSVRAHTRARTGGRAAHGRGISEYNIRPRPKNKYKTPGLARREISAGCLGNRREVPSPLTKRADAFKLISGPRDVAAASREREREIYNRMLIVSEGDGKSAVFFSDAFRLVWRCPFFLNRTFRSL